MSRFASICPALIALLALTAPSPAAAQTSAALMPSTGGHREIPDSVREEATRAALEYLRTEDLAVLAPTFVVEVLDEAQRACAPNTDCMSDVRGALGVELLAGLILWGSAEARASPRTVHATLLDASGVRYLGTAEVARGVPTAVRDALRAAREAQRRGPGPFLDVAGTRGAIAELDGAALGSLPLEAVRVEPGEHQLRVHLEGYETQTLTVAIGDDPSRTTRVEVELQPSGGGQPGRPPGAGLALSDWAIPVGVGATVAGAGLAVAVPLVSLAMTGCTEETGGACVSSDQFAVGANVAWIIGGGGTGKELVAEALHASSPREGAPFVRVNCAALVDELLSSELFGHERGAFTGADRQKKGRFELADGGTILLDEIGDISPRMQAALLRVLQERTFERVGGTKTLSVNVRVIAATHRDLKELVREGRFREDLFYRLSGITVRVPALRERLEDLPELSRHLLQKISSDIGGELKTLAPDAIEALARRDWPGNVRELENALRSVAVLSPSGLLTAADFAEHAPTRPATSPPPPSDASLGDLAYERVKDGDGSIYDLRKRIERELIERALDESGGNISRAAELLGMKRPRLSKLVHEWGLK